MKSMLTLVVLAVLAVGMTGCVSQRQYDDLRTLHRKAQERIVELEGLLADKNEEIAALRSASGSDDDLRRRLAAAEEEAARLRAELRELAAVPHVGDLTRELVSALEELARQYPDLMTFDEGRKAIQLQSDLTFDLGSTRVKAEARDGLARLARVLGSRDAAAFEVRVVGHTDNVPVTNPANKQKFEDNWGLSAFRAKSVMEVLRDNDISESRMSIAGYGEHQPVVQNPARGGAQANRRVEIFLVPPYRTGAPVEANNRNNNNNESRPARTNGDSADTSPDETQPMLK